MRKIDGGVRNNISHAINQQPKIEKQKISPNIQSQPIARGRVNSNISENTASKNNIDTSALRFGMELKLKAFIASKAKPIEVKATYIPADQRHKGLSKYDNLPHFKNRPAGFPDRYRAVNPKLKAEGVKGEDALHFPLKKGEHILYDGNGDERGTIIRSTVKLNYAQVRIINGEKHYYAFATKINHDKDSKTKSIDASGWIKASAIEKGNDPKFTPEEIKKSQPPPVSEVHGKYENYEKYDVKNVSPNQLKGADGKPKYGFIEKSKIIENGKLVEKSTFVSYKVLPGISKDKSVKASDYLMRGGNVVNLGFNPAGLSDDTFKVDGEPIVFHRAPTSVKSATVDIDLFHPKDKDHAGKKPVTRMRFVYGFVEIQGNKRWGWMALGALEKKNTGKT